MVISALQKQFCTYTAEYSSVTLCTPKYNVNFEKFAVYKSCIMCYKCLVNVLVKNFLVIFQNNFDNGPFCK